MTIGITNVNSKININETFSINTNRLTIDKSGNMETLGNTTLFGKLICNKEVIIDGGLSSSNSNINIDSQGNILSSGTIYTKNKKV